LRGFPRQSSCLKRPRIPSIILFLSSSRLRSQRLPMLLYTSLATVGTMLKGLIAQLLIVAIVLIAGIVAVTVWVFPHVLP
jgi:hypothetical protein